MKEKLPQIWEILKVVKGNNFKTFSCLFCSLFHLIKLYRDLSKEINILAYLFSFYNSKVSKDLNTLT